MGFDGAEDYVAGSVSINIMLNWRGETAFRGLELERLTFRDEFHGVPEANREQIPSRLPINEITDMLRDDPSAASLANESATLYLSNISIVDHRSHFRCNCCIPALKAHDVADVVLSDEIGEFFGFFVICFDGPFDEDVFVGFDRGDERAGVAVDTDTRDYEIDVGIVGDIWHFISIFFEQVYLAAVEQSAFTLRTFWCSISLHFFRVKAICFNGLGSSLCRTVLQSDDLVFGRCPQVWQMSLSCPIRPRRCAGIWSVETDEADTDFARGSHWEIQRLTKATKHKRNLVHAFKLL